MTPDPIREALAEALHDDRLHNLAVADPADPYWQMKANALLSTPSMQAALADQRALARLPRSEGWTVRHARLWAQASVDEPPRWHDQYECVIDYGDSGPGAYHEPVEGIGTSIKAAVAAALGSE